MIRHEHAGLEVAYLLPDPGIPVGGSKGASVHVESLCAALARHGVDVTLYAARVAGPMTARGSESVRVVPIDIGHVSSGKQADTLRIDAANAYFDKLERFLSFREPGCIIERLSLFAGRGSQLADGLGLARLVEVNAPVADERKRHFGLSLEEVARQAESDALCGASVVAVSEPLARWALDMGARTARVIPNGADVDGLDPNLLSFLAPITRSRLGLAKSTPVIGFIGSLKPWHGVDVLIEAVSRVSQTMQVGLLIVGDGPEYGRLSESLGRLAPQATAVMTGAVQRSHVAEHIAAMDISVAPYAENDSFYFSPLKVVEAMAAGRAVVASDFPPIRDLLGPAGVLVTPSDPESLAQSLERLLAEPETRRLLGATARARAVERSSWSGVADTVLSELAAAREKIERPGVGSGSLLTDTSERSST